MANLMMLDQTPASTRQLARLLLIILSSAWSAWPLYINIPKQTLTQGPVKLGSLTLIFRTSSQFGGVRGSPAGSEQIAIDRQLFYDLNVKNLVVTTHPLWRVYLVYNSRQPQPSDQSSFITPDLATN